MKRISVLFYSWLSLVLFLVALPSQAAPSIRAGSGMDPADIQSLLDLFVIDLGGADITMIDWDEINDDNASPNSLPADYYLNTDPRGIELATPGTGLAVSADSDNPTSTPTGFGDIDPAFEGAFQMFSSERLFAPIDSTQVTASFSDNSGQPTSIHGFGAVFSGVDEIDSTFIRFVDSQNNTLTTVFVPPSPAGGLSFLGVTFGPGEAIGGVLINAGTTPLAGGVIEGNGVDLVVIDNILFNNPVPEPATVTLLALGAALLAFRKRA